MADLLFEVTDYIATITLNRPEAYNAFSEEMITEWIKALETVRDQDDIRVVIVKGNGKSFCAGHISWNTGIRTGELLRHFRRDTDWIITDFQSRRLILAIGQSSPSTGSPARSTRAEENDDFQYRDGGLSFEKILAAVRNTVGL